MSGDETFLAELRSELLAAHADMAPTRRPRRGLFGARGLLAAAVVVVVAAVGVVLVPFGGGDVAAEVEAIIDDGWVQVRLLDLENRPSEIAEAARSVGLDVEVVEVPVGPAQVGRFVSLEADATPPELRRLGVDGSTFTGFRIPEGFDGSFTLNIGRLAEPGEEWQLTSPGSDVIGASCEDLVGSTVDEVQAVSVDAELRWFAAEPGQPPVEFSPPDGRFSDYVVFAVEAPAPDELWVQVSPDGESPFPAGYPTEDASC